MEARRSERNIMAEMENEKLLLQKEREVFLIQASEIREELEILRKKYEKNCDEEKPYQKFCISDFLVTIADGSSSKLLFEAIKFCETHDGCPYYEDNCPESQSLECGSIWIKMGTPCWVLVDHVKRYIKALKGTKKT